MEHLHQVLAVSVRGWREAGYPCEEYPAITEILEYQTEEGVGLRFLREPQLRALETYWYLRLVEGTPRVLDLYRDMFPKSRPLREALSLTDEEIRDFVEDNDMDALFEKIVRDDEFVLRLKLEPVRETVSLDYPSYIFALAMGAGKTVLIGAIVATEFAMALEHPKRAHPDADFLENALIFAPGKTILGSLREIQEMPFDEILPPRLYKPFSGSLKLQFTRDGDPDVPVVRGSRYNVVVTNTEKIRIQRRPRRTKPKSWSQMRFEEEERRNEAVANRRLETIGSLPFLGVFSDEAHHTYGQEVEKDLKRVRQTVDYLARETQVVCVINTTGTPYFKKRILNDVVIWYGLAEGIADGILKEVEDSIQSYRFDAQQAGDFVRDVVTDFFTDYAHVRLPDGTAAKLAIYFPQTDDLDELRPQVEAALSEVGQARSVVLTNTSKSSADELDAFSALNEPESLHRVILLVNKGTEGWNCPSLFATALARSLGSGSNNFVLQAASRCLRQVPGNDVNARIYISEQNRKALDDQLQQTYGETMRSLAAAASSEDKKTAVLELKKHDVPPIRLTIPFEKVSRTVAARDAQGSLVLEKPNAPDDSSMTKTTLGLAGRADGKPGVLSVVDEEEIGTYERVLDLYTAAAHLSAVYRLGALDLKRLLAGLYTEEDGVPEAHLPGLALQIEQQVSGYHIEIETREVALAVVKREGWRDKKTGRYVAAVKYSDKDRHKIVYESALKSGGFGFHYEPYDFDSVPEVSFFEQLLKHINTHPDKVEDIYFTGGTTDLKKTDFYVEYRDAQGKLHTYTPDFLVRLKPEDDEPESSGRCLVVEIKGAQYENVVTEEMSKGRATSSEGLKALAVKDLEKLQPGRIEYEIIFAPAGELLLKKTARARRFVEEGN